MCDYDVFPPTFQSFNPPPALHNWITMPRKLKKRERKKKKMYFEIPLPTRKK